MAEVSKREANGKKPIYGIHKWFGRKTDAIVRSILVSIAMPEYNTEGFQKKFYSSCSDLLKGKIILDPFMGGGITLVNTLRMGGKAIGVDVNPVAWFITKNELQLPGLENDVMEYEDLVKVLKSEFIKIEKAIGSEIKSAYKTKITLEDGITREVDIMYVLWIKKITCPHCERVTKLFPRHSITKIKKHGFNNINICPFCEEFVFGNQEELTCSKCNKSFFINKSSFNGRKFICKSCGRSFNIIDDIMKKRDSALDMEMYAIQYYDSISGKKGFKKPDKYDIDNFAKAKEEYNSCINSLRGYIPSSKVPKGFNTKQVLNHNYNYWSDMFNERQLLFLSKLLKEIDKISDTTVREMFLCMFSNTINSNNMFSIYNCHYGKIEPLFGDHHLAPVMNPVENNIWGTRYGRGSFIKNFNIMLEGKKYNFEPFERIYKNNKRIKVNLKDEKFHGKFTEDFENLQKSDRNTILKCCSADELSFIPSESIDGIVTDPPYYSAINYGEISEFFYSWQKIILKRDYEEYEGEHLCSDSEVTVNTAKGIEKKEFEERLTLCFKELNRVLKSGAPMIFTYNNSSIEGWTVIFNSLRDSGFVISEVHPVPMEYKAGLIEGRRQKMSYDLIISAVKGSMDLGEKLTLKEFLYKYHEVEEETMEKYGTFSLNRLDELLIRVGVLYKLFFKYYPNIYSEDKIVQFEDVMKVVYKK